MGLRFEMKHANWIAYLIQPGAPLPHLEGERGEQKELLRQFLKTLQNNYLSNKAKQNWLGTQVFRVLEYLDQQEIEPQQVPLALDIIREAFIRRSWTALIIPSGLNEDIDQILCSEELLRFLVDITINDLGLILQLETPPTKIFTLTDIFPAFRAALTESNRWPGVLLWTTRADSVFLPLPKIPTDQISQSLYWIFSQLSRIGHVDLEIIRRQYMKEFTEIDTSKSFVHIIQISDIHLGSKEADRRIPRVQQLIRNLLDELEDATKVIPVVSGDILESPTVGNVDRVRSFIDFLSNLGIEQPIIVLGNHDVRTDGFLDDQYRIAFKLPHEGGHIVWFNEEKIGVLCFNSLQGGNLASGNIGERQLVDVGNEIDRKKDWKEYVLLSVLHHHPVPVEIPEWYIKPFYERVLGNWFSKAEFLQDASAFIQFNEDRGVSGILHGHRHIPRIGSAGEKKIPIFGCGSTVGKVNTQGTGTYMSINVVTLDCVSRRLSGRLLAERIPGGGLYEEKRHEVVYRQK